MLAAEAEAEAAAEAAEPEADAEPQSSLPLPCEPSDSPLTARASGAPPAAPAAPAAVDPAADVAIFVGVGVAFEFFSCFSANCFFLSVFGHRS